jgi:branched-chain amino acid transport system substrate-binding protein
LAKKSNIIHFSMASDSRIADGTNNFLAWSPEYEQAAVLVNTLKQKKVHEIGVIATEEHSDKLLSQSIIKEVQNNSSIKISIQEQVKANVNDYASLIKQLKNKNPDVYVIMASPEQIESIQTAMSKAHINKPITSIVERVTPKVMKVFNQQWYVDSQEMKPEFIKEYQEAYMNYPTTEAGYAFDVFNILNKSILASAQKTPEFSVAATAKQIHIKETRSGVMGALNFDAHGVLYTQSEVKKIKDGHILTA